MFAVRAVRNGGKRHVLHHFGGVVCRPTLGRYRRVCIHADRWDRVPGARLLFRARFVQMPPVFATTAVVVRFKRTRRGYRVRSFAPIGTLPPPYLASMAVV